MKLLSVFVFGLFSIVLERHVVQSDYVRDFGGARSNSLGHGGWMSKPVRDVPQQNHPEERNIVEKPEEQENPEQEDTVPLWLLESLDNIDDPYEFLTEYVEGGWENLTDPQTLTVGVEGASPVGSNQNPDTDLESRHSRVEPDGGPAFATPAGCQPQPTVVPLNDAYNPRLIVYPKCTIVNKCQGCCHLVSNTCQPKKTEKLYVRVIKAMYVGDGRKLEYLGKYTVELEEHTECACSCKVQPTDCNIWQTHNPYTCQCECKDADARMQCFEDREQRVWEDTSCTCRCKQERPCSSGLYFDHDECRCKPMYGLPRVYTAGRHGFFDEEMENDTETTTRPWLLNRRSSTTSTTTTTTTTTTPETTAPRRIIDSEYLRRLQRLKERQKRRRGRYN